MINKTLKSFAVFFIILGISFSNIPFYALTGLIDSYEKTSGIVDKIWLLEQHHSGDIVDNFSSIKNFAKKLEIPKAMAAVSIRNVGAYVNSTGNTLTPVIPATAAAGDMMLMAYGTKPYNDAPTIDQGWLSIGSATDGTVAAGIDVGSMQTRIYYKIHTGSEVNPTVTNTTNNISGAVIIVFQKAANETWETPVGAGGGDATAGTGFSVTASANPGITAGDMLVGYAAIRSDAGTQSAIGITATGLTVGAFTESPAADLVTSAGGDMAMSGGYRSVTAGTASAAPVYASTLAAAHTGSAFIVRLRVTPNTAPTLTVTQPDGTGDTVTVGDLYNITYNLADTDDVVTAAMYYDTDAVGLNGTAITGACATAAEGAGATCSWDTTGMTPGNYYVYGITNDGVNPAVNDYSPGVITINSAVVVPDATSYTDDTEVGLNNLGGRTGQTITLTGTNFDAATSPNRANCAGGAGTGCVQIGGYTIPDGNFTVWNSTTITFSIPSAITSYGTTVTVTSASQSDTTPLSFKVYPDITAISPSGAGEAKEGDTITITGTRFGSTQGTNKILIDGVAATISSWGDTSIQAVVPSAINDANNSVTVRAYQGTEGDNTIYDDSANFVILPKITGTIDTVSLDAAREYNASDTDGVFTVLGNHFGAGGTVTILGGASTQQTTTTCTGSAYQATCVGLRVPDVAGYTGDIVLTRTADSKTNTYSGFRVLPRIISLNPTTGPSGTDVTINGDHLCQTGTCPVASSWNSAADDGHDVEWGTTDATVLNTPAEPTDSTIYVDAPAIADGNYQVTVTSGGGAPYVSNEKTFTINSPPSLSISQPDGVGDTVAENSSYNITYTLSDTLDTVTAAFYYDTNGSGLDGAAIAGTCATATEGAGVTCSWNTTGMTPGSYYVYGITNDGVNPQVSAYSSGTITINDAPTITISQPDGVGDTVNVGDLYNITYDLADTDNIVTAAMYYDIDAAGLNGTAISGACATAAEGAGVTCSWNTTGVTPGSYYVYGITNDGVNSQASDYSSGVITINAANTAPTISVSQPPAGNIDVGYGSSYNITYTLADGDSVADVDFYYDTNNSGNDGVAVTGCQNQIEGTNVTCSWNTTGYPVGTAYYVYGKADDGVAPSQYAYSAGTITIKPTLTVVTAGDQTATIDSGSSNTFLGSTTGTPDPSFTFSINTGSANITAITINNNGTAGNLSDIRLYYDTDGNYTGVGETCFNTLCGDGQGGTLGSSIAGSLSLTAGNTYYVYAFADIANTVAGGLTVDLRIANPSTNITTTAYNTDTAAKDIPGSVTVRPNVTSINYAVGGDGAREGNSITVNGAGFGTACNVAGGSKVTIGTYDLSCTGATFNNTTITITVDNAMPDNNNGGTGASGLLATIGNIVDDARSTFYVYPTITSLTVPTATPDAAREYSASDSDGLITVNGKHFDSPNGTNPLTILGSNTSGYGVWGDNSVTNAQIPTVIVNNLYTGNIVLTRSDGKSDTYSGFRVLPRITDLAPSNGVIGTAVTANGDHLCQSGVCPGSFSAVNKATFNLGVDATVFTSWSDSAIATAVPAGATTGNVVVISDTSYTSNALNFTVDPNTTTIATGTDPSANTIAPGAGATNVNQFTLQTNGGTENITSVTVNLSTNSGIGRLAITTSADAELGFTTSPATGSNTITVSGMSAGASLATFKVRITPLSHTAMPAPNGGSYSITAPVTAWAGGYTHSGSDTNPNALTIDNESPVGATTTNISAGDANVTIDWTTSGSADFNTSVVLRWAASSAGGETPTEGQSYSIGATIGTATIACVVTSTPSTIQTKIDGTGGSAECTTAALTNEQSYTYKIFGKDANGNHNTGVLIGTATPSVSTKSEMHEYTWAWDINDGASAGRPLGRNGNYAGGAIDSTEGEKYQALIIDSNANQATNDRTIRLRWVHRASGEVNPTMTFVYWCTGTDGAGANCPAGVPTAKASAREIGAPADTYGANNQIIRFKDSSLITHISSVTTPVLGWDHNPVAGLNMEQKCVSCTITLTNNQYFEHDFSFEFAPDMPIPANNIQYQIRMKINTTILPIASMHGGESNGQGFWTVPANYVGILNSPTGVSASAGDQQITLNWTPSASSANSQMIFRSTSVGGPYIPVKQFYNNTTATYTDTGLTNGTTYYYVIRANKAGINESAVLADASIGSLNSTEVSAMPNALELIVSTSGSQAANFDSGTGNNYLGGAFTFSINIGTANVTGIKISNNGTAGNLSDVRLYYDTDGTYSGGESCFNSGGCADGAGGALGASIGGAINNMTPGNIYYVYVVADIAGTVAGGTTIDLQITNPSTDVATNISNTDTVAKNITGSTTVRPNVASYSNSTEPALTDGAREMQTISISGAGFGTACNIGAGSKVTIGTYDLSCTGATFNNTTITIAVDSAMPDTNDGGTGSSGLLVTIGATADDVRQTFYVYPNVTSITVPTASTDAAREYSASDSDGVITINGTHFGSAGSVTILGSAANQQTTGTCSGSAYQATCVGLQIPTAIADNSYTGNIVLTRSTGGSKSGTFAGFRVLPRIVSLNPDNGITNDPIVIIGNHLCQSGTCPLAGSRSTASDNVIFASGVQVTDGNVTAWGHGDSSTSGVNVNVPAAAIIGNVVMKSNNYDSNGITFTKQSSVPNSPTGLNQYKNDGTTAIAVGNKTADGVTNNLVFKASMSGINPSTLCLQVENAAVGAAFTGAVSAEETGGNCESYVGTPVTGSVTITGLTAGSGYHWRARIKNSGTNEYGDWVAFGANPSGNGSTDGSPANNDYYIDTTAPVTSVISSTGVTASGATITWNTDELADSQVKYDTVCPPVANSTSASQTGGVYSHSVALSNLTPGITYQYQVVSQDRNSDGSLIGNSATGPSAGTCNTFLTSQANMRTAEFIITGETSAATTETIKDFQVYITEQGYSVQSAFVELSGIAGTGGGSSLTLGLKVEGESGTISYANYTVAIDNAIATPFTILHKIDNSASDLYIAPTQSTQNKLYINPSSGDSVYIASAKIVVTYYYTP